MTSDAATLRLVESLLEQGQAEAAVILASQAVNDGSRQLPLYFRLGAACLKTGRYAQAREVMARAAALDPGAPAELLELAQRLLYFNLSGAMREVAGRLLARPLWHAAAESDFAAMLSMMGEQDMAGRLLDRALGAGVANPGQLYNRSQMHLYSGRMLEAEKDLRRCLALEPRMAKAWWALGKLPLDAAAPQSASDLASMQRLCATLTPGSQDEAFLRFALFNRLDRAGHVDAAWKELAQGCAVKRRLVKYESSAIAALFAALQSFDEVAVPAARTHEAGMPTPIFIVGMHRSGTTLLERILGNHSRVAEGGELYDFPAALRLAIGRHFAGPCDIGVAQAAANIDFAEVGRTYLAQVHWRARGRAFLVDKLPSNFQNIGFIRRALPGARIIHMRRGAMDTCFSNFKELFSNACAYSYDLVELADYYAMYRRLLAHWHAGAPGSILDVDYEDLARDPRTQAARILDYCGLDWEDSCLDTGAAGRTVNTASSAQVREPIHQRNIQAWRRYEQALAPLQARLAAHGLG